MTWRPKFLKDRGKPVRLRWWVCFQLIKRLDVRITRDMRLGRELMFNHHEAGPNHPKWAFGKQLTLNARVLEARMLWLAYEGGAQYFDGGSRIELIHVTGMDILHNPRRAR